MEQYGFFVNTDICTGCKACMTSCFDRNNLEVPQKFRKVYEFGGGEWKADETGAFTATAFTYYASMTCGHCENPACVANCPTGAMAKREDNGAVVVDQEVCIGCGTCVNSCPYEVPQIDEAAGVSSKCTMCFDRLDNDYRPWCVQACPAEARIVGDLNDPESEVSKYIAGKGAQPYMPENGTTPSVYYV